MSPSWFDKVVLALFVAAPLLYGVSLLTTHTKRVVSGACSVGAVILAFSITVIVHGGYLERHDTSGVVDKWNPDYLGTVEKCRVYIWMTRDGHPQYFASCPQNSRLKSMKEIHCDGTTLKRNPLQ